LFAGRLLAESKTSRKKEYQRSYPQWLHAFFLSVKPTGMSLLWPPASAILLRIRVHAW